MNSLEGYSKKSDKNLSASEKIFKIWSNIPFFMKFFLLTTLIFYILNLFIKRVSFYYSNIPYYTIYYFQIWRLITTVFISTNLFKLFLGLLCWVKYGSSLESSIGTVKYMIIFFSNTLFIQLLYCLLKYCIMCLFHKEYDYLLDKVSYRRANNNSLIGNIMCELTLLCLSNPESPNKLLLIPFTIKAKYYPILLIGIFIIVDSFKIDLEMICGNIYAYIYFYFLKSFLKISDSLAEKIEENICCKNITDLNSFISVSNINNGTPVSIMNVSVNQIKFHDSKDNTEIEDLNINKGAIIQGNLDEVTDEYSKL